MYSQYAIYIKLSDVEESFSLLTMDKLMFMTDGTVFILTYYLEL